MPTGPAELHEKYGDDQNAIAFLKAAGYTLTRQWDWIRPQGHTPTQDENEAIFYLVYEWDFGGLRP